MTQLKLGVPKGSLEEATIALFRQAGWQIQPRSRNYFPTIDDPEISCALVRSQEMATYVSKGVLDVGLTGLDWILDSGAQVEEVCDLIYSKSSDQPCRWVLVVPQDSDIQRIEDLQGKRVATELVNFTRTYMQERGIDCEVEFSWGATEAKAVEGLVDAVVEITETGSTIRAHGLRIVCDLLHTHTRLIASPAAMADPWKKQKIEDIALLLQASLAAHQKVALKMNAPKAKLGEITALLPSLHAPTVSDLADTDWVALETVVDRDRVRSLIPDLRKRGAEGILEYELRKII
ncbi:MAG: ATP phosphoribosyltransferase [Proteobacteria bacterium]|jgi:ATP phosphoribosyltransferase|nr:ATP phosphoribosyltransferase [Pseudomonadota bacterium]MDB4827205.1 ATP phosphoribosyltransferase [Gammaproteobacteria bacterium]MBT4106699.1 ATP phosphoribosyltransferase [Pseudomonadota bacterium]MBT4356294.1 ATP phosphoribosyltransferase [Pseudomonadota bacterium]MBT4987965.1 ATP phosphoribosyltransferase [Pseudomonadota bacterium]